jgi:hypothetical protein
LNKTVEHKCVENLLTVVEVVEVVEIQDIIVTKELAHLYACLLIVDQEYAEVFLEEASVEKPSVVYVMQQQEKHVMKQAVHALSVNQIVSENNVETISVGEVVEIVRFLLLTQVIIVTRLNRVRCVLQTVLH